MMGIYIKGMEMPKNCEDCPMAFAVNFGILCTPTKRIVGDGEISKKQGFCPLIPVPPHGRLIDADALKKVVASAKHMDADIYDGRLFYSDHLCVGADYDDVCKAIDETPTIIPASKEE